MPSLQSVKQFYTYLYLRYDGTPYYVGKGSGKRAFSSRHRVRLPRDRKFILLQDHDTESDALFAEQLLIAAYGRKDLDTGCLRNWTNGGEGVSGISDEARRKKVEISLGNQFGLGYRHTAEAKLRIGKAVSSIPHPWSKGFFKGRHHSEASRRKISDGKQQKICINGHTLSEDNLLISTRHDGRDGSIRVKRNCKACAYARLRGYKETAYATS
jgi:hypothetical protein